LQNTRFTEITQLEVENFWREFPKKKPFGERGLVECQRIIKIQKKKIFRARAETNLIIFRRKKMKLSLTRHYMTKIFHRETNRGESGA